MDQLRCPVCGVQFSIAAPRCRDCGTPNSTFSEVAPRSGFTDVEPTDRPPHTQENIDATVDSLDIRLRDTEKITYYSTWTLIVFLLAAFNMLAVLLLLLTFAFRGTQWGVETADWVILAVSCVLMVFYFGYGSGHLRKHHCSLTEHKTVGVRWYQAVFFIVLVFGGMFLVVAVLVYMSTER